MKFLFLLSLVTLNSFAADCFFKVETVTPVWKGNIKQKFEFLVDGKSEVAYKDRSTKIQGDTQKVTSKFYCDCEEMEKCSAQLKDFVKKVACNTPPKGNLSVSMIDSSNWSTDVIEIKKGAVAPSVTHVLSMVEFIKNNKPVSVGQHEISCAR
jgi:hypothetical protein